MNLLQSSCLLFVGFALLAAIEQVSVLQMVENEIVQQKYGENVGAKAMAAQYQNCKASKEDRRMFCGRHPEFHALRRSPVQQIFNNYSPKAR